MARPQVGTVRLASAISLAHDLEPGQSAKLHATLAPATYKIWCPVGPHAAMGMRLELTVTEQ